MKTEKFFKVFFFSYLILLTVLLGFCAKNLHAASPMIWNSSSFGKLLSTEGFLLNDDKQVRRLTVDPTAGAGVSAPIGSIGLRDNGVDGEFWFKYDSADTQWTNVLLGNTGWSLTGNAGTTAGTNFLGTLDAVDLVFKTNNTEAFRLTSAGAIDTTLGVGILHSDASGILTSSAVDLTADVTGVLPIANGGTNSSTALNNNRVMISSGGAIVEQSAITANRAIVSDASGLPVASTTTDTEIGYVSGVTSAIQTQLNAKQDKVPTGKTLWVDGSRVDVYVEDGTETYPFKDPQDAVDQIVTNGDNSTSVPYTILIKGGVTYGTINVSNAALYWVNFVGLTGNAGIPITTLNLTGANLYRSSVSNFVINTLNATSSYAANAMNIDNSYIYNLNVSNVSDFRTSNTEVLTPTLTNAPFVFIQDGYLGITGITTLVNSNLIVQGQSILNSVTVDATSGFYLRPGCRVVAGTITNSGTMQFWGSVINVPVVLNGGSTLLNRGSFIDPANISGAGTYTQATTAQMIGYTPTTSSDWNTVPTNVRGALDTLATSGIVKSQNQNLVLASPNGSAGLPSFRALVAADLPSIVPSTYGSRTTGRSIVAGTGITSGASHMSTTEPNEMIFVAGTNGVDITANPQIEAHTVVGAKLVICGTSDTNYVLLENGNGLSLNGPAQLGKDDCITLLWGGSDGSTSDYIEQARNF